MLREEKYHPIKVLTSLCVIKKIKLVFKQRYKKEAFSKHTNSAFCQEPSSPNKFGIQSVSSIRNIKTIERIVLNSVWVIKGKVASEVL